MTLTEYENGIGEIEKRAKFEKDALTKEFCFSNNPYKVGDVIKDHVKTLKIETIKFSSGSFGNKPECVYWGTILNKDGTPKKKNGDGVVWQSNIIK